MLLKVYRVKLINQDALANLPEGATTYLDIVASSLESAWGKFCRQHFGVLKPNPADYDVHFEGTRSV